MTPEEVTVHSVLGDLGPLAAWDAGGAEAGGEGPGGPSEAFGSVHRRVWSWGDLTVSAEGGRAGGDGCGIWVRSGEARASGTRSASES